VLGALLAGMPDVPVPTVAALAALVHGRAGRVAGGVAGGDRGGPIVASDIVDALPVAIRDLLAGHAVRES
jgi:ADP-dependent NAD(P)H-hydrate dehydratase / NAD(P)H-hydrate epimerase